MKKKFAISTVLAFATVATFLVCTSALSFASANAGVTPTTIRIGIPYIDFSSLKALGVSLNHGNVSDAFNALIANVNAHGGIDVRKLVAYATGVNPANSAAVLAVCTQLTEDDQVFVAMDPYMPNCYLEQHGTPTIGAALQGSGSTGAVPNFGLTPPQTAYDPLQLSVFSRMGLFKGKKVGVFATSQDEAELSVVQSALKKLRANVVQTGVDSAPANDQAASNAQSGSISEKFQNLGVNEVVAVGSGSSSWPAGLSDNQSAYRPPWIATAASALSASAAGSGANDSAYLKNVVTSLPGLTNLQEWQDPAIQSCVRTIKKAYPSDAITPPSVTGNSSDHSYVSAIDACQSLAIFTKIATAAGKNLTVESFTRAGYGLRNVTFPGSGGPVSFAPGRPYAIGPVFVGRYSMASHQLEFSARSASS